MTIRVTRDWRGIKHKVSECSTDELQVLRTNAQQTSEQVARFTAEIDAELAFRDREVQDPRAA
jgi:hypothetical protein